MTGSYDFEEQERLAELKAWWEDNRWYVLGAIAAGLLAFAGYRGYHWWTAHQAEEAAASYKPVAAAVEAKDNKKADEAAQKVIQEHPGSFYASDAALMLAKNAFDAGKLDDARKQLEWVVANGVEAHRGVARVRLAGVLMEQKKYDDALRVLDGNKDEAYAPLVADMRGDIMVTQHRLDEARANYKLATEKADVRNPVKSIAQTKLNALGGAQ
ncbi:MAG TPA: tetratricopeptide repeat protein [Usitatibacter sp.]|jgi:predicted negative regulator of RcsB-dependent stress response